MKYKSKINKIPALLVCLSKRSKIIAIFVNTYLVFLVLYDLVILNRSFKEIIITYSNVIVIGIFVWFGIRFVFWLQIKNKSCSKEYLDVIVLVAMIVFGVSSICLGVQYFINGFLISTFIAPIAFLSLVKAQFLRK